MSRKSCLSPFPARLRSLKQAVDADPLIRGSTAHFLIGHSPIETSLDFVSKYKLFRVRKPRRRTVITSLPIVCSGNPSARTAPASVGALKVASFSLPRFLTNPLYATLHQQGTVCPYAGNSSLSPFPAAVLLSVALSITEFN